MARFKQNCPDLTPPTGQGLLWIGAKSMIILTNHDSKTLFGGGVLMGIYVIQFFKFSKWSSFPFEYRDAINPQGKIYYVGCLRK